MTQQAMSSVVALSVNDLDAVEALRARNNETLGFLAKSVMADYLRQGGGLGVRDVDGLIAYVLFARHQHHIRIIHLCVSGHERGTGHARRLVDAVVDRAREHRLGVVRLNCRRDYPANAMWPRLDFVPLAQKKAKTDGAWLTTWCRGIPGAAQEDIFATLASDDRVNAVIDVQLLIQLHDLGSDIAKGLRADFLSDLLSLHITDETFNEIHRATSPERRTQSWKLALSFPRVQHDADRMSDVAQILKRVLPSSTRSQESDIRQLAMTAASDVEVFLTRDEALLRKAPEIKILAAVEVLHPFRLIVRLDEFTNGDSYSPAPVSGTSLAWRKFGEVDTSALPVDRFLGPHERKSRLKERLATVLSHPHVWRTEGLWSGDTLTTIRSTKQDRHHGRLVVGICRASRGPDQPLFTEYAVESLVHEALDRGYDLVELEPGSTTPEATAQLARIGFMEGDDGRFVRDCPAHVMSRSDLLAKAYPRHRDAELVELERACSPVALEDGDLDCLMIPIRPGYARSLFDTRQAAADLFGADKSILLRFQNVYFRKCSHHRMIKAPARILWYVSDSAGVIATSHLDSVRIGPPKDIFRANRRLGALGWPEIQEMCGGDAVEDIMALKFSHSCLFRSPVDHTSLKRVYSRHSRNLVVQSPSRVPPAIFLDIFRSGFQTRGAA